MLRLQPDEQQQLQQLREAAERLGEAPPPDYDLLRFLRGRGGDVVSATQQLSATAAWRRSSGFAGPAAGWGGFTAVPPRLPSVPFEELLLQRWPQTYLGRCAAGRPVVLECAPAPPPRHSLRRRRRAQRSRLPLPPFPDGWSTSTPPSSRREAA